MAKPRKSSSATAAKTARSSSTQPTRTAPSRTCIVQQQQPQRSSDSWNCLCCVARPHIGSMYGMIKQSAARTYHNSAPKLLSPAAGGGSDADEPMEEDEQTPTTRGRKRRPPAALDESPRPSPAKRGRGAGRGGGGRGRQRRGGGNVALAEKEDESSLFAQVHAATTKRRLGEMVDKWMREYEKNAEEALVQLQQLFISASGCKGVVTLMLCQLEYSEIIRRMTDEFDEDSADYPIVMPGAQWRRFRGNLSDFVQVLVHNSKSGALYDQVMMDRIIQLLTCLSDSQVRAFRHTATLASMKLSSALVDVCLELVDQKEANSRQLNTEKQRLHAKRGGNERLEFLISKKQTIDEHTEEIRNMLQYMFKSVFVHRYRDVVPDIRCVCIEELGSWIVTYPEHFLEDSYLKYVGWTLHDKVPEVRLRCLQAILPLYSMAEPHISKLELFTNKFKVRLVSMALDKDTDVAVVAVKVLTAMLAPTLNVLESKDCESIYLQVYCSSRPLAVAAGEFLCSKLCLMAQGDRAVDAALMRDVIVFFLESGTHQHTAYLVDALIDVNPLLRDWPLMTAMLLASDDSLTDAHEAALIDLMINAIKQSATGEQPCIRAQKKVGTQAKEQNKLREERRQISDHFIQALPALLQKYMADKEKLVHLLQIPQHFVEDVYVSGRHERLVDELLARLADVAERHSDSEVLNLVAEAFGCLCEQRGGVEARCEAATSKVIDGIVLKLRGNVQQFVSELGATDDEDAAALTASFRRLTAFYTFHDLSKWDLWETLCSVQVEIADGVVAPLEVREKSLLCCSLSMQYDLLRLTKDEEPNRPAVIERLRERRKMVLDSCCAFLLSMEPVAGPNVFGMMVDTEMAFNRKLAEQADLKQLHRPLQAHHQRMLATYVVDEVFGAEGERLAEAADATLDVEASIELTHRRRSLLAAFCKLVVYGSVQCQFAADVVKFYVRAAHDYFDIIKQTLYKIRDLDRIKYANLLAMSLTMAFNDHKEKMEHEAMQTRGKAKARQPIAVDTGSEEFAQMRDLAKKFSQSFGVISDPEKNREAVATVHRLGILFAFGGKQMIYTPTDAPPQDLPFYEILCEFVNKLTKQDRTAVFVHRAAIGAIGVDFRLRYVDRFFPQGLPEDEKSWQSLHVYRNHLAAGEEPQAAATRGAARGRGKARGGRPANTATPTPSEQDD